MFRKPRLADRKPRPRGDTILSVMISVVIIGSVIGTTYHLVNSSLRLGRAGQERSHAVNVIDIQIERIKAVLDLEPDRIFKDTGGVLNTPPQGFGDKFCLVLNEIASNQSDRSLKSKALPPPIVKGLG